MKPCLRLAEGWMTPTCGKSSWQAREWMQAEMDEEDGADIEPLSGLKVLY
jgi:hypothetical protein